MPTPCPTTFSTSTLWRRLAIVLTMAMLWCVSGLAMAQAGNGKFDHLKTGFALTGAHTTVRCESCHINGVFKGTPKDCRTCHSPGGKQSQNSVVLPGNHIPTTLSCESCHGTQSFTSGRFSHTTGIAAGQSCVSCHDGSHAQGKGPTHIATQASCESCHKTTAWEGAKPPHDGFTAATNCANCHNGSSATGKVSGHIPVSANCFSCHSVSGWKPTKWNHTQVTVSGACATCHSGNFPPADGKPSKHIPYTSLTGVNVSNCDSCHKGGYSSWNPGKFHSNITLTGQCATCHLSSNYGLTAKPSDTIHSQVTSGCESCHSSTSSWAGSGGAGIRVDHSLFTASTNCASCHNGSTATGKSSTHVPTLNASTCFTCHSVTGWTPTKWTHRQATVKGACSTCHTGSYLPADGKPADHIPYASFSATASANCDSCHTAAAAAFTSWNPGQLHANFSFSTGCASCHTGSFNGPDAKPGNHIPYASVTAAASAGCETCHKGSFSSWATGKFHSNVTTSTQCASCHLNSNFGLTAKPNDANHTGVTGNCESCHKATTNWAMAGGTGKPDHSTFTAATNCANCHNGSTATGKSTTHVPTLNAATCFTCHSITGWTPTKWTHSASQVTVKGACSTCHTGGYAPADGKPANHIPYASLSATAAANCDSCHKGGYASWNPGQLHANFTFSTGCATCHTGAFNGPDGKAGNHIPYASVTAAASAGCETCHKGSFSSWATGKFHSNVTTSTQCASCHLTSAFGLTAKPSNSVHSTVTGNCESCHTSTTGWANGAIVVHTGFTAATNCANCHNGSAATGKTTTHIPTTGNCFSCHNVTTWTPTKWNHTQTTVRGACSTCHTGGYAPADGKPGNHIPYASVTAAAAANCDTCHKSGYTSWNPGQFHSNVATTTQCASCHLTTAYTLTAKPNDPTHSGVTGNCESCHKSSASWTSGTKVDHSGFNSTTNCSTCHNGSNATGKTSTHIPTTVNCFSCHNVTTWTPTKWNHTQSVVSGACSTCHTGAYAPADGKPSNHIPYAAVSVSAAANCDTCHKGGYTSWATGKFHSSVTTTTQCASCHLTSAFGQTAKPSNALHSTVTGNCESCHKITTDWASGAKVDHSTFTSTTNCGTCHNGSSATGKGSSHIPTTVNCFSCHNVSTWTPTKWNHTQSVVSGACSTCHTGAYAPADGKPSNHIPYAAVSVSASANCDSCHKGGYTSWTTGKFHGYFTPATQCATCHTGGYLGPDGKVNNHIPYATVTASASAGCETCHKGSFTSWATGRFHGSVTTTTQCASCHLTSAYGQTPKPANTLHSTVTGNCESCHTSTADWTSGTKVDHSTFTSATNCASCHNGSSATGKTTTHIPTTVNCFSCHSVTAWTPTKWNHTQTVVANACSTCHSGSYSPADGKPANHIPYAAISASASANCDSCHKGGYTSWATGKFHAYYTVTTQCATCHSGAYLGPDGKTATHIPYASVGVSASAGCESCHKSTSTWTTGKYHSYFTVTSQCNTCHNSPTYGQMVKPNNHIPLAQLLSGTSMDCSACHKSTVSGGFATATMNHNNSQGNGSGWCFACHNTSTSYLGNMQRKSLTHRSSGATDCSKSGCHRPLGNTGTAYRNWN